MLFMRDDFLFKSVRVAGPALGVVMRLKAERIRFTVAFEEAGNLLLALRDAQDAVGNIRLGGAGNGQISAFALHQRRAGKFNAAHLGLGWVEHRIKEFDAYLVVLCGELLV